MIAMYQYPLQLATTDLRPDIVLWHENPKEVTLIELTACFETVLKQPFRESIKNLERRLEIQSRDYDD